MLCRQRWPAVLADERCGKNQRRGLSALILGHRPNYGCGRPDSTLILPDGAANLEITVWIIVKSLLICGGMSAFLASPWFNYYLR